MNEKLKNISSSELLDELIRRKEIVKLKGGIYHEWELFPKYILRNVNLPEDYDFFITKDLLRNLQKQI